MRRTCGKQSAKEKHDKSEVGMWYEMWLACGTNHEVTMWSACSPKGKECS
jgi:hypothetical protein